MVDKDILWSTISSLQKHVDRIKGKSWVLI